ncbi:MAG: hypothetical protein WD845_18660, partial [Pirellulales bacterium]
MPVARGGIGKIGGWFFVGFVGIERWLVGLPRSRFGLVFENASGTGNKKRVALASRQCWSLSVLEKGDALAGCQWQPVKKTAPLRLRAA